MTNEPRGQPREPAPSGWRDALHWQQLAKSTSRHAGLWLDRSLKDMSTGADKTGATSKSTLVDQVASIVAPPEYTLFFQEWHKQLVALGALVAEGKVRNRMVVGLGTEAVLDNSIAIHRTYGVPYIPGSAIKGLVSAYAHQRLQDERWRKAAGRNHENSDHALLFGTTEAIGTVTFLDALYVPDSAYPDSNQPLVADVITVHHQAYYRGDHDAAPADWDDPVPVPFISATGSYLFAVKADDAPTARAALQILAFALDELGIGAKTSSGYGRITLDAADLDRHIPERTAAKLAEQQQVAEDERSAAHTAALAAAQGQLNEFRMQLKQAKNQNINNLLNVWRALPEIVRRVAAAEYQQRLVVLFKQEAASKPTYKTLQSYLDAQETAE